MKGFRKEISKVIPEEIDDSFRKNEKRISQEINDHIPGEISDGIQGEFLLKIREEFLNKYRYKYMKECRNYPREGHVKQPQEKPMSEWNFGKNS